MKFTRTLLAAALVALKVRMNPAPVTEDTQDEETPAAAVVLTRWSRFWSEAAHGWTTLRRTPVLWLLTLNSMAGNIGMALFAPIEAVWVLTDLQLGPEFVGFQLTAGALGALTVSALAPRAIDTLGEKGCILAGAAGYLAGTDQLERISLLALAVTGRADDAVASPGETRDSLEQAAADARFPREERHAAAGRIAQHYAGQGPEVRR